MADECANRGASRHCVPRRRLAKGALAHSVVYGFNRDIGTPWWFYPITRNAPPLARQRRRWRIHPRWLDIRGICVIRG
jgi:hypothetical protein